MYSSARTVSNDESPRLAEDQLYHLGERATTNVGQKQPRDISVFLQSQLIRLVDASAEERHGKNVVKN